MERAAKTKTKMSRKIIMLGLYTKTKNKNQYLQKLFGIAKER